MVKHTQSFPQNKVSEWLLFNTNSAIASYHGKNKLIINEMMRSAITLVITSPMRFPRNGHRVYKAYQTYSTILVIYGTFKLIWTKIIDI